MAAVSTRGVYVDAVSDPPLRLHQLPGTKVCWAEEFDDVVPLTQFVNPIRRSHCRQLFPDRRHEAASHFLSGETRSARIESSATP